jgi:signal peptidase II
MSFLAGLASRRVFFCLSALVLLLDQISKFQADALLRHRAPVEVIPGFFNLWYSRNRGGLFGYFSSLEDPWRGVLLTFFPLLAIGLITAFLATTRDSDRATLTGLALILGGATGNLVCRVFRGEVIDFLDVYVSSPALAERLVARFGTAHWPTFNLADSAIVIGASLLILDVLRPAPKHAATVQSAVAPNHEAERRSTLP